jgi:hypothetical protein
MTDRGAFGRKNSLPHNLHIMPKLRIVFLSLFAVAMLTLAAFRLDTTLPLHAAGVCTLEPGRTLALARVEQDTTLPFVPTGLHPLSLSGVREGADSLLATATTPMPAGRVRLLQLDSATRSALTVHGITDSQPIAFVRAAPYRADCRTIRWTDSAPFVERGEIGYMRGTLAPREQWIDGVPLIIIPDAWNYPYPRRRGLAFRVDPDAPLAPAEAMFSLNAVLELPQPVAAVERIALDSARRERAIIWARANPVTAELEPVRSMIRRAVLEPDWSVAERLPSRLRGTYRVDLEIGSERSTWFFRTHDRPGYTWRGMDSLQTTAELLASPYIPGYRLVGYAAPSPDLLPAEAPRRVPDVPLVWIATDDRPTAPDNDARRRLSGVLEFQLAAAPEPLWNVLEELVPRERRADSAELARLNLPRDRQQAQIPLPIQREERDRIRSDTSLIVGSRALRVVLERVDTVSMRRPF